MSDEKKTMAVFIKVENRQRVCGHYCMEITAEPVYLDRDDFSHYSDSWSDELAWADMAHDFMAFSDMPNSTRTETRYRNISRLDLRQLEKKLKVLRMVESKLEKMNQKEGYCETPGMAFHRFARAIGAKYAFVVGCPRWQEVNGAKFRRMDLSDIQYHINNALYNFREETKEEAAA